MSDFTNEYFEKLLERTITPIVSDNESREDLNRIISNPTDKNLQSVYSEFLDNYSTDITNDFKADMFENVMVSRAEEESFKSHLKEHWNKALVSSEFMYLITIEFAEIYRDYVEALNIKNFEKCKYKYTALLYIHGRALQQYLEVITLVKNGFPDGAFARWRSLYELSVIALFLSNETEVVSKSYIDSSTSNVRNEWAKSSESLKHLSRITFKDIEKASKINAKDWDHYLLSNQLIHASSQGTFFKLGDINDGSSILIGRTDSEISLAAENSAISLAHISVLFFNIFPSGDSILASKVLNNWIDLVHKEYTKVEDFLLQE